MTCARCGFEAPLDFAFCPKCGTRLAATSSGEAEVDRRPVTVLFADLSGFTALSERLDPEDVRALQGDLFKALSETIERFDGFVEKFVGDAVMAVFGAPVAHEDDPERALRAALAMRDRAAALNERWTDRLGAPLALHIGVDTGPVVAGHIRPEPGAAYAVTGDTVNTASRLQSAAAPGQILVSQSTYALARHAFGFEVLGPLALKGKAEPVAAYRLDAALPAPRSARGLEAHGLAAPLVGRERELGELVAAFERMLAHETQVVSIVGEAGVGKTRLVAEFIGRLQAMGRLGSTAIRRAACFSVGERTYGVPAALLRDAYDVAPDDPPAEVRRKVASGIAAIGATVEEAERLTAFLGCLLGYEAEDPRARELEPEHLERQMRLAVQAVVERRLAHGALLLIVEDLHWADAASVELLRFLVDRVQDRQFMLLVSHRQTPEVGALASGRAVHTVLRPQPLSTSDSDALLGALFGPSARQLPESLRSRILERAGGNPLFLEEMVRCLIAGGVLAREGGEWVCRADSAAAHVPVTVHGLLLARIDRLPARARQVIQEAAVVGPVFSERLLREVAAEPESLHDALALLVDASLLTDASQPFGAQARTSAGQGQYRFCHGLFHEAAYQNLLVRRRTELHTRIGRALERLCGDTPQRLEDLEALGHHFGLSVDKARGARYLVAAGDWARRIYANADAIRLYERALETLEACDGCDAERLVVHERLGELLSLTGQRAAALFHLAAARAGYSGAGDLPGQARVLRKIGALHWAAGDRTEAVRCTEEGLRLIEGGPEHVERAHLYQERGQMAFRSGDNHGAVLWAERALAHAERIAAGTAAAMDDERRETSRAMSLALNTLGVTLARLDRPAEALAHLERSVSIAREANLLQAECSGLANLGVLYSTLDPARAIATCERGLATAKRIGDLGLQSRLYANLAVAYCGLTNRCDERGIEAAQTAIELDRQLAQLDHLAVPLIVLAQIYQCHGEPARALGHYQEAMALAESVGEPQLLFPCYDGLATLYLDMGEADRADHYMRKAQEVCERARLEPDALTVLPFLV